MILGSGGQWEVKYVSKVIVQLALWIWIENHCWAGTGDY